MADQGFGSRRTSDQQEAWERQCYGCLAADFKKSVEMSIGVHVPLPESGTPGPYDYNLNPVSTSFRLIGAPGYGAIAEVYREPNAAKIVAALNGRRFAMPAMSILSDAQEMIERGDPEGARQAINRAKLLIGDYWMGRGRE